MKSVGEINQNSILKWTFEKVMGKPGSLHKDVKVTIDMEKAIVQKCSVQEEKKGSPGALGVTADRY